VGMVNKEQ